MRGHAPNQLTEIIRCARVVVSSLAKRVGIASLVASLRCLTTETDWAITGVTSAPCK